MLKKLFQKRQLIQESSADRVDVILRLMFEIAVSDGNLDNTELTILKRWDDQISAEGEKASDVLKKVIDEDEDYSEVYTIVLLKPTVLEKTEDLEYEEEE